jgi:putative two-component system response regulator
MTEASRDTDVSDAVIMVVDDDAAIRRLLVRLLQADGYRSVIPVDDPASVVERAEASAAQLILLDLHMPGVNGLDVISAIQTRLAERLRPDVVVLTGDHSLDVRHSSLRRGAADFLTKPLDSLEVQLRVRNLLRMRSMQQALWQHSERLEELVRERTQELDRAQLEILERLARAAEHRDDDTGQHTRRVADMAASLALQLERDAEEAELIRRATLLHDLGKIGIPDAVLLKPGMLSESERELMQRHTRMGAAILSGSRVRLLRIAEEIARSHHERWDGGGYPDGLADEAIPLNARIVAVADTYDALTHERPYKRAWTHEQALQEIHAQAGGQFDHDVVRALQRLLDASRSPRDETTG